MSKKDPRMKDCPWLIPYFTVRNAEQAIAFYEKAFGFERGTCVPGPDGKIQHAEMMYQGQVIVMFAPEGMGGCVSPATSHRDALINLYVYSHDVDALYLRAVRAGIQTLQPPTDMFWGDRIARFKDPDGYDWTFGTHVREFDPAAACAK